MPFGYSKTAHVRSLVGCARQNVEACRTFKNQVEEIE